MVTVAYDRQTWRLDPGTELTVGRSSACTVRLPHDAHLSRRAASLRRLADCVLVANLSRTKPLVLRPPVGADRIVEPGAATTSLPFAIFDIVLAGAEQTVHITVDASTITPAPAGGSAPTTSTATAAAPVHITPAQHRVLVELCRPLLDRSGPEARPATYAEIAGTLRLQASYVRNVVKDIRGQLAGYGVPGLDSAGPERPTRPNEDFRLALAQWAWWSGLVTQADLDRPGGTG